MGEYCRWGSCTYTTTNNMFDILMDLKRDGVDPIRAIVPPNILVDIPKPLPLNDKKFKSGHIDSLFIQMREDAHDLFEAADAIAGIFFGDSFVKAVHEWYGLGTALELYALWSVGYINDPDEAFGGFDT